ncbi:MAG: ATP-binding protein [Fibrobacter sp.]|nr:ATP-binding protein [Fibrobacter sp.]
MVYGESGTGKSTSLRNFQPGECSVINVSKKPLPFRNQLPVAKTDDYKVITDLLQKSKSKSLVIDDATYLMTNEFMRTAKVTGFQKFTDMAKNFFDMIQTAINLPDDKIVYIMGHVERDQFGNESFKSIGKLLSEKVTLEGLFTIVLKTVVKDGRYQFATQTNGMDTVKSPMGMFEQTLIDNDLKAVDQQIRSYYGI